MADSEGWGMLARWAAIVVMAAGAALAQPAPGPRGGDGLGFLKELPRLEPVQDWLVARGNPYAMPIRPENGAVVLQTPPDFSWPRQGAGHYQFRLRAPDGRETERLAPDNFMLWPAELPPGSYAWSVRFWPRGGAAGEWSAWRQFTVPRDAWPFAVGSLEGAFERAAAMPRPRTLPKGPALEALRRELLNGARRNRFAAYIDWLGPYLGGSLTPDVDEHAADQTDVVERRRAEGRIVANTAQELQVSIGMAFVAVITGRQAYVDEAKRRLLNLATWSPYGGTGNGSFGLESQTISRYMTLAYDWLYPHLTARERRTVLENVAVRQAGLHDWYVLDKPRLLHQPYDAHGYLHIGNLAATAAVLAGDVPGAKQWLDDALPLYLMLVNPWGGDDGGYANGMNYAFYDAQFSFLHWDMLREVLGLDTARKAWTRNFGLKLAYFHPPGAPAFVFGDGAGNLDDPLVSTVARAYALRSNTAIGNWLAAQNTRSFPVPRLYELLAPLASNAEPAGPSPDALPNAAHFPSIGWVAMHSNLRDRMRNSVYFKASPYGGYNHGHSDQNSFVIHSRGRELAIDSGYFYLYDAPHWREWTKQTRAHNAVTYNGGQGQLFDDRGATGAITAFRHTAAYDYAAGDATWAYGGNLKRARRTLAFFRPDTVVVYDSLEHYEPVRFEWNIHAKNNMVQYDAGKIGFSEGPASLCVELQEPERLEFIKFNEFSQPVDPPHNEYSPLQWHARFIVRRPEARTEFLALLKINCQGPNLAQVERLAEGGFAFTLGQKRYRITEAGVAEAAP